MLNRVIKYMTAKELEPTTTCSLTKWLSVRLRCTWLFVRVPLKSVSFQISRLS